MNTAPSEAYFRAIEEGRQHHASSKTYSGSLLRPHKPYLTGLVQRLGCTSALDVGAGKGRQWEWRDHVDGRRLEEIWGFDVTKHDPCWPPFAAEPAGPFDLVLCTHTICLIPLADLHWFTERLYSFATKALFVAEKIGERKKGEIGDPDNRAIEWPPEKWIGWFGRFAALHPGVETHLSLRVIEPRGKITTRHVWRDGAYVGAFEAEPHA